MRRKEKSESHGKIKKWAVYFFPCLYLILAVAILLVVLKGDCLSPIQILLVEYALALYAAIITFLMGSSAVVEGTILHDWKFRAFGPLAAFLICLGVMALLLPAPRYKSIAIYLKDQGKILDVNFRLVAYLADIDPLSRSGEHGETRIQVPSDVSQIRDLQVSCEDYEMQEVGPFAVKDGSVSIAMIRKGAPPPLRIDEYPSVDSIDMPSQDEVDRKPVVNSERVTFRYKNLTNTNLLLVMYNWYLHYHPVVEPLGAKSAWTSWNFPACNDFVSFDGFSPPGTGWYSFFVVRTPTPDNSRRAFFLGTKNVFYARIPTFVVKETGRVERPYEALFGSED